MNINEKRRLPGQGCGVKAEKNWGVNNPTLAKSRRPVNIHGLFFQARALTKPMAALSLREVAEFRI